ncbi:trypsin-like cysteine/serine peptidase domain-containing protein, partial [Lipomyces oligophaga]|uniref:trypsin-like cysteine/serine peptidase domain-containing protein n=1 Tax=Lipomyces oligophaga TaxID=45792 RepID=UPI0034CDD90C
FTIHGSPFALDSPALFLRFAMYGRISGLDRQSGVVLADMQYLDGSEGSCVVVDDSQKSIGLVVGCVRKRNGNGELVVIYPWTRILNDIGKNLGLPSKYITSMSLKPSQSAKATAEIDVVCIITTSTRRGLQWGTGIPLKETLIVSNDHVVPEDCTRIRIYWPRTDEQYSVTRRFAPFKGLDMVLLRLERRLTGIKCARLQPFVSVGEEVRTVGFGLRNPVTATASLEAKCAEPIWSSGHITGIVKLALTKNNAAQEPVMISTSSGCWNGSSGGAILSKCNSEWTLVGMITSNGRTAGNGISRVIPHLGFAIPSNLIYRGWKMIENGEELMVGEQVRALWAMESTHDELYEPTQLKPRL